jgi:transcriptional regulator
MYSPGAFKSADLKEAFDLMHKYPFATVVTVDEGQPIVSHLPITPVRVGEKVELIGHLARANPQWRTFAASDATVIFQGPHTYITPAWYVIDGVPTWNYSTVHVTGKAELIEDQGGLVACLKALTAHVERYWPSGWDFSIPDRLQGDVLPQSIVGFRVKAAKIDFKQKLSQNRSKIDREGVLKGLESRRDESSQLVRQEMLKLFSPNGEPRSDQEFS